MTIEAMKQALDRVVKAIDEPNNTMSDAKALKEIMRQLRLIHATLRQAIEQAEKQEPVAQGSIQHLKLMMDHSAWDGVIQLSDALANIDEFYTTPQPQREWQGLTDEEVQFVYADSGYNDIEMFASAIEAKLKEKNHVS